MTTDDGGWTRVVGMSAFNVLPSNPAAVPWTAGSPSNDGKLADTVINLLKSTTSSTTPVIRLMANNGPAHNGKAFLAARRPRCGARRLGTCSSKAGRDRPG